MNTDRAIEMLKSSSASKRYEACEELRVARSLPPEALTALTTATDDPDQSVADAARRAISVHSPPQASNIQAAIPNQAPLAAALPKPWPRPFLIYGALAGLPIPLLGWLWIGLSIFQASKLGWRNGLLGVGLFFVTAIGVRLLIGILLVLFTGGY